MAAFPRRRRCLPISRIMRSLREQVSTRIVSANQTEVTPIWPNCDGIWCCPGTNACGRVVSVPRFVTPASSMAPLTWTGERRNGEVRMNREMLDRIAAVTTAEGTRAPRMGIKILSASASEVVATMPVAGNTQPFGLLHGGASCVLAETIGSLGAALHAGLSRGVVGIEISATPHRGARDGDVTAVATLAHGGRTIATYEIVITDSAGHRVCTSRLTCLIRDQVPGRGANGTEILREQGVIGS